jgi:hypothetical protein
LKETHIHQRVKEDRGMIRSRTRTSLRRVGYRRPSATVSALLVAATAAIAVLIAPASASANNDPHRMYLAAAPFDLPANYCGFPVHFEFPVNKEYATVSTGPDGSTIYKVTGALFDTLTNTETGKTITVNASGPGTSTFSADGTRLDFDGRGLTLFFATNLTQFGLPSNLLLGSGPNRASVDLVSGTVISMPTVPHVLLDVCASLSS